MRYSSTYNRGDSAAFYVNSVVKKKHQHNYLSIKYHKFNFLPVLTNSDFNYEFITAINRCTDFITFKTLYSAITTWLHHSCKVLYISLIMQLMNKTHDKNCKKSNLNLSTSIMHSFFYYSSTLLIDAEIIYFVDMTCRWLSISSWNMLQ